MSGNARLVAVLVAAAAIGCGSSGSGVSKKPLTATPQMKSSAKTSVDSATELGKLKTNANDSSGLGAFGQIYGSANVLVGSVQQAGLSGTLVSALTTGEGCATTSGGTITYDNCTYGSTVVDGTITVNGDTISIDVVYDMSGGSSSVTAIKLDFNGSVTVTAARIDGTLTVTTDAATTSYGSVTGTTVIDYNAITLAGGCATGGTLDIQSESGMAGYTYTTEISVAFGPSCGDATMTGGTDMPGA
jgi:hypothetical protein